MSERVLDAIACLTDEERAAATQRASDGERLQARLIACAKLERFAREREIRLHRYGAGAVVGEEESGEEQP